MKKYVAASDVDEFLDLHESLDYHRCQSAFDEVYDILSKYGDDKEDVDVVFKRATPADQAHMLDLFRNCREARVGEPGYCRHLYYSALEGRDGNRYYNEGVVDAFEALFEEGLLDEESFRTDL